MFTVHVENIAPYLSDLSGLYGDEGQEIGFSGLQFYDVGWKQSFSAQVDWGDGTGPQEAQVGWSSNGEDGGSSGIISSSHVYVDNGDYPATVMLSDGSDVVTTSFRVTVGNMAPVATPDTYTMDEDQTLTVAGLGGVLANDMDAPGDLLTSQLSSGVSYGSLTLNPDGSFSYKPQLNFNKTDSFRYFARDDDGAISKPATVTITVNPVNDAPVAAPQSVTTNEDQVLAGLLTAADVDGDALTYYKLGTGPLNGTVSVTKAGSFTYTPNSGFFGTDSFRFRVYDGKVYSPGATVNITVSSVNDAPSFVGGSSQTLAEDSAAQSVVGWATTMSAGPANEASQVLGFVVMNDNEALFSVQPAISPDGTLTYTPAPNANGAANVTVVLKDDGGTDRGGVDTTVPLTFVISITSVNDAPSFVAGVNQTVNEDAGLKTITGWATAVSAGSANEANQTLAFTVTNNNSALFLSTNQPAVAPDGTLTYRSAANKYGSATVSVILKDDGGTALGGVDTSAVQTFTITVNPVNDAPVGKSQTVSTNEDQAVTGKLTATDVDNAQQELTFRAATLPRNGSVEIASNGDFSYVPQANFNGQDTFGFLVNDGKRDSTKEALVTINIAPVNDAPVAGDDSVGTDEDVPVTVPASSLLANDTDVDEDGLAVTSVGNAINGSAVLNGDGSAVFTPSANFSGTGSFEYTVSDGHGGTDTAIVTVAVIPVNDAPVAVNDPYVGYEDTELRIVAQGGLMKVDTRNAEQLYGLSSYLYADFGAGVGLYRYSGTTWKFVSGMDAEGMAGVGTTLYVDFGSYGIYKYASSVLTPVAPPEGTTGNAEQLYGLGTNLYADFGPGVGLYSYDGSIWKSVSGMDARTMTGVGTTLYVGFGSSGVYQYASGALTPVDGRNAEQLLGVGSYLYADFGVGVGVYRYYAGNWTRTTSNDAEGMTKVASTLYLDCGTSGVYRSGSKIDGRNAEQLLGVGSYLYADFGEGVGLCQYDGNAWSVVNEMDAQGMAGVGTSLYVAGDSSGVFRHVRGMLANDTDVDRNPLTAILETNPAHGTVLVQPDGSFIYTPAADFNGTDSFGYKASDGAAQSNVATVTITVNAVDNLMASHAPVEGMDAGPVLSSAQLRAIVDEAIDRWAETKVVDEDALSRLESVTFRIADLSGLTLGQATSGTVLIDVNGAGYGWYVDATAADDLEFGLKLSELELMATATSPALGRMDLLTVVMHELGHVLGYQDLDSSSDALMGGTLDAGTRRLNDSTAESSKLVQMEKVPGGEVDSSLWGAKDKKISWLEDFLVDLAGRKDNPFDPMDKIKISIPGNNGGGSKKKLH
jgi:VCBS repeat-containing protein